MARRRDEVAWADPALLILGSVRPRDRMPRLAHSVDQLQARSPGAAINADALTTWFGLPNAA
jgi:hypothetical protein